MILRPAGDWEVIAGFAGTLAIVLAVVVLTAAISNKETLLTILGTGFSIAGLWVAAYVACWAYGVEKLKWGKHAEENDYYRIHLVHELSSLVSVIRNWQLYDKTADRRSELTEADKTF